MSCVCVGIFDKRIRAMGWSMMLYAILVRYVMSDLG